MRTSDSGAASVELALFAMFLVMIASGVIDLGRGLYTAVALNDAVQEGAMFAAFTDDVGGAELTADDIAARVVASTSTPQLDPAQVGVTCVTESRARQSATRVSVTVTHSVDLVTPLVSDLFGDGLTLTRSATVDRFFEACPAGGGS